MCVEGEHGLSAASPPLTTSPPRSTPPPLTTRQGFRPSELYEKGCSVNPRDDDICVQLIGRRYQRAGSPGRHSVAPSAGRLSGPAPGLSAGVAAAHRAERAGDLVEPAYHEPVSPVIRRELWADDMRASGPLGTSGRGAGREAATRAWQISQRDRVTRKPPKVPVTSRADVGICREQSGTGTNRAKERITSTDQKLRLERGA